MAVVTALFMMPTAVVFPALLRLANTPPASGTLTSVKRVHNRIVSERLPPPTAFQSLQSDYEQTLQKDDDEFMEVLEQGEHTEYFTAYPRACPVGSWGSWVFVVKLLGSTSSFRIHARAG